MKGFRLLSASRDIFPARSNAEPCDARNTSGFSFSASRTSLPKTSMISGNSVFPTYLKPGPLVLLRKKYVVLFPRSFTE